MLYHGFKGGDLHTVIMGNIVKVEVCNGDGYFVTHDRPAHLVKNVGGCHGDMGRRKKNKQLSVKVANNV